jgi:hypothetical protein
MRSLPPMPEWMDRLGWVLVHFLWQGALIGGVAWVGMALLARASAQARYLFLCGALLACCLAPCLTWMNSSADESVSFSQPARVSAAASKALPLIPATNPAPAKTSAVSIMADHPGAAWNNEAVSKDIDAAVPYLVLIWILGVTILALRLVFDWTQLQRLCGSSSPVQNQSWLVRLKALADRMGVHRAILLLESARVEASRRRARPRSTR